MKGVFLLQNVLAVKSKFPAGNNDESVPTICFCYCYSSSLRDIDLQVEVFTTVIGVQRTGCLGQSRGRIEIRRELRVKEGWF